MKTRRLFGRGNGGVPGRSGFSGHCLLNGLCIQRVCTAPNPQLFIEPLVEMFEHRFHSYQIIILSKGCEGLQMASFAFKTLSFKLFLAILSIKIKTKIGKAGLVALYL